MELKKYPRTPHLSGSKLQVGDEDLSQISFSELDGKHLVVEEKCDGANSAISFDETGALYLQSRGHYLTGGYRERHYKTLQSRHLLCRILLVMKFQRLPEQHQLS